MVIADITFTIASDTFSILLQTVSKNVIPIENIILFSKIENKVENARTVEP